MKLNVKILAHSLAVVGGGYYIICTLLALLAPDLYKSIVISWAHGVDVEKVWKATPPDFGTLLVGFVSFTIAAWITGYVFGSVYNYFLKSK